MATFTYRTLNSPAGATIEAVDRGAAVRELVRRGETPVSVVEGGGGWTPSGTAGFSRAPSGMSRVMGRADSATFIRELATALSAGLPLVAALRTMMRQGRSPRQKEMLEAIVAQVEQGRSLADAMAPWQRTFGELTVNLVRAGEVSGQLAEVLTQAAELLDKDLKLRRSISGAIL
ncbi:MAG: type II secretion system F family protein, partial [Phycisphaerales bacterium]